MIGALGLEKLSVYKVYGALGFEKLCFYKVIRVLALQKTKILQGFWTPLASDG